MKVKIDISGAGTVKGAGEYAAEAPIEILATPVYPNRFKEFIDQDGNKYTDNPVSFIAGETDLTLQCVFYTTIEDYLSDKVGFTVSEGALNNIRIERGITYGEDVNNLDKRTRELAYADILMWGANSPTTVTGAKDSDGGWIHQEESRTMAITDKRLMRSTANEIYRRYGDVSFASSMKVVSLFGSPYRK